MLHLSGIREQAVQQRLHLAEHVVKADEAVSQCHALGAGMADVAFVPQGHVIKRHLSVRLHNTRKTAHAFHRDGVALMGHGRRTLLTLLERLFRLDDIGLLQQAHLHGNRLQRRGNDSESAHHLGVAVARDNLRGQRIGRQAQMLANILFNEGVDAGIRTHRTGDSTGRDHVARLLHALQIAREHPGPAAEFHAECHRLGGNAMGTPDAQRVFELERATLAHLTELLDVLDDDVARLRDLIAQRHIAQIRRGHTVVHPTTGLFLPFGDVGVDVFGHIREERNDIVIGNLFDFVDTLDGEVGMRTNPRGLFFRDARSPQLGLRFTGKDLDFLPNLELVLQLPNGTHRRTRIAINHEASFLAIRLALPQLQQRFAACLQ